MQRPTLHDWAVLHDWDRNSIDNLISSIECHSERICNLKQSIWEYKTFPERHTRLNHKFSFFHWTIGIVFYSYGI
jgi:hypothetical protein